MIIIFNCKGIKTEPLTRKTSYFIGFRLKLIAVDSESAICYGPFIIVELQLGQSAEVIGILQIRFGLNRHIEVLDCEKVIFHRKHVASDGHYLFGVDLSKP